MEHDDYGSDLAFPDYDDAVEVNKGVLEEMPETGGHAVWDRGLIDSALHRPQQRAVYDEDSDIFDLGADLAHAVVQNHGFENGNHRTAHVLTHEFFEANGFGHVIADDDDDLARHIMGFTAHGQAKNEGEIHTPDETAAMFRERHARHQRGEPIEFKHHEPREGKTAAPLKWCPDCSTSHNTTLTNGSSFCWNCKKTLKDEDLSEEDPQMKKEAGIGDWLQDKVLKKYVHPQAAEFRDLMDDDKFDLDHRGQGDVSLTCRDCGWSNRWWQDDSSERFESLNNMVTESLAHNEQCSKVPERPDKTAALTPEEHAIEQIMRDPKDDINLYEGMNPEDSTEHVWERHNEYQTHPIDFDPTDDDEELQRKHDALGPHEHLGHKLDGEHTNHVHAELPVLDEVSPAPTKYKKLHDHLIDDHFQNWQDWAGLQDLSLPHDLDHETGTPTHLHGDERVPGKVEQWVKDEFVKPLVHPVKFIQDKRDALNEQIEDLQAKNHFQEVHLDENYPGWRDRKKESHEVELDHVHDPMDDGADLNPMYTQSGPIKPEHIKEFDKDPRAGGYGYLGHEYRNDESDAALADAANKIGLNHEDLFQWTNSRSGRHAMDWVTPTKECPNCFWSSCENQKCPQYSGYVGTRSNVSECKGCGTPTEKSPMAHSWVGYKTGQSQDDCDECGSKLKEPMIQVAQGKEKTNDYAKGLFQNMGLELPAESITYKAQPYKREHLTNLFLHRYNNGTGLADEVQGLKDETKYGWCPEHGEPLNKCVHSLPNPEAHVGDDNGEHHIAEMEQELRPLTKGSDSCNNCSHDAQSHGPIRPQWQDKLAPKEKQDEHNGKWFVLNDHRYYQHGHATEPKDDCPLCNYEPSHENPGDFSYGEEGCGYTNCGCKHFVLETDMDRASKEVEEANQTRKYIDLFEQYGEEYPSKEAHVGDDQAAHHTNSDKLMEDHPYWSKCRECGGDGIGIGTTDVNTGEQKQKPCGSCSGLGEEHDMEYWDSEEQLHDFANYPAFREQKIPEKGLKDHMKAVHEDEGDEDDAYMQHQGLHGQIRVDPEIAGILFSDQKAAALDLNSDAPLSVYFHPDDNEWHLKQGDNDEMIVPEDHPYILKKLREQHQEQKAAHVGENGDVTHHGDDFSAWNSDVENDYNYLDEEESCDVCDLPLDPEKGEAFLTDDGGVYCNDHYPNNDTEENFDGGDHFYGKLAVQRTRTWYLNKRDTLLTDTGGDRSTTVHDFGDGWKIKRLETTGDAHYEGNMMKNCIKDIAQGGCSTCNPYNEAEEGGECRSCYGTGMVGKCSDCGTEAPWEEGSGKYECSVKFDHKVEQEEKASCVDCEGSGRCGDCSGEGTQPRYHDTKIGDALMGDNEEHPWAADDGSSRIHSLRDPDNIPQVSFIMKDKSDQDDDAWYSGQGEPEGHNLSDIFGKTNNQAKPEHGLRVSQFFKEYTKDKPGEHTVDMGYHHPQSFAATPDEAIHLFGGHDDPETPADDRRNCGTCKEDHDNGHNPVVEKPKCDLHQAWFDPGKDHCTAVGQLYEGEHACSKPQVTNLQEPKVDPNCPECQEPRLFNVASAGDTTDPTRVTQTPNFLPPTPRGKDPWQDHGDNGLPLHNPGLKHKLKREFITDEMSPGPVEINSPGNGLMSEAVNRTRTWYLNQKKDVENTFGKDTSTTIHKFDDGWTVKKLNTVGDAMYEGTLMKNCIKDQVNIECKKCAGSGVCEGCGGNSEVMCSKCQYTGETKCPRRFKDHDDCNTCDGTTFVTCENCRGHGSVDCNKCAGNGYCGTCGGDGFNYPPGDTSLDDKSIVNHYKEKGKSTIHSLRDPDNIPQVSFTLGGGYSPYNSKEIDSVFGRTNSEPKPEHQKRLLNFFTEHTKDIKGNHEYRGQDLDWANHEMIHMESGAPLRTFDPDCFHCRDYAEDMNWELDKNGLPAKAAHEMMLPHVHDGDAVRFDEDQRYNPAVAEAIHGAHLRNGDATSPICGWCDALESLQKKGQSWDTADSYSRNPDHDVPPSNRGQRGKYDPWTDKADTGELILPLAEGEDIKKWKTLHRPKPSVEQTTNQPQDKMKMEQVVGAATMKRCEDCGKSSRTGPFVNQCRHCGGALITIEKSKKSAGWEWLDEFVVEAKDLFDPALVGKCGYCSGDGCDRCRQTGRDPGGSIGEIDFENWAPPATQRAASTEEDWTDWELETMKPKEPFLMSPHTPEQESEEYFNANLGTRVFPDWDGAELDRHIVQHHNGSIKDHGLIHFGHDEDADWTDQRAHYHESAFKPKGKLTQVGEDENGKPIYRMAMDLSGGGYDPVRDVSPSGKSAPAPSAQGQSGDPWPDQGDNGTAPPRPGFIFDPNLKKYIRDMQMTYPQVGPTFPGVTDVNKIGKDEVGGAYNWVRWTEDRDDGRYLVTAAACPRHKRNKADELPDFESIRTHGVKQCYFCGKSSVVNEMKVASGEPGALPQQVGDHQADNGIDKPGGDKDKVKKWLPSAQEAVPGNDQWNVSIDNQVKTGQAEKQTAEPEPAPKLTDLQLHLIEHPTHEFPPELLEDPQMMNNQELEELHIYEHANGVFDHNPEALRVAKKDD